jgi:hypothetical protein
VSVIIAVAVVVGVFVAVFVSVGVEVGVSVSVVGSCVSVGEFVGRDVAVVFLPVSVSFSAVSSPLADRDGEVIVSVLPFWGPTPMVAFAVRFAVAFAVVFAVATAVAFTRADDESEPFALMPASGSGVFAVGTFPVAVDTEAVPDGDLCASGSIPVSTRVGDERCTGIDVETTVEGEETDVDEDVTDVGAGGSDEGDGVDVGASVAGSEEVGGGGVGD